MEERMKIFIERRDGKWYCLGKYFKRRGQCEKYVRSQGFIGI